MKLNFCLLTLVSFGLMAVSCVKDDDGNGKDMSFDWGNYREATSKSVSGVNKVFEYTPAPGQFINIESELATAQDAADYVYSKISDEQFVSLGAFGGYVVVGFDHSIPNASAINSVNEYDLYVGGNSYKGNSEPGIVYVMKDSNGNGLPDDTWYELKGSEYGNEGTVQDYEITYFKPEDNKSVKWEDSLGESGVVDYNEYHTQRTYYPTWITADSYKLKGTRLKSNMVYEEPIYTYLEYAWGYSDNFGGDLDKVNNRFKIDNAIDSDGNSVKLAFVDFVKVQTGVNAKGGWIGELSTEFFGAGDAHL